MADKQISWIGSSLNDLTNFPDTARKKAGFQLTKSDSEWRVTF
jgi:phage-related protein